MYICIILSCIKIHYLNMEMNLCYDVEIVDYFLSSNAYFACVK